jgi:hypothetical protein
VKLEVDEITKKPETRDSAAMISVTIPSAR